MLRSLAPLACTLFVLATGPDAQAILISVNPLPDPAVGTIDVQLIPGVPGFAPDTVIVDKVYNSLGVLGFEMTASGPTPEIQVIESITNNTGIDWTNFDWELTAGTAVFTAAIVPSFPNVTVNSTTVSANGAVVPSGAQLSPILFASANPVGVEETITIVQHPTAIPEPSTFPVLFVGGVTSCGIAWRTRWRAKCWSLDRG